MLSVRVRIVYFQSGLTRKQLFRQEDRINKSGFRKRRTPQNDPIGFALIHSPSVLTVSPVVNFAGFWLNQISLELRHRVALFQPPGRWFFTLVAALCGSRHKAHRLRSAYRRKSKPGHLLLQRRRLAQTRCLCEIHRKMAAPCSLRKNTSNRFCHFQR